MSGSSLLTLGADAPHGGTPAALVLTQASAGLLLVALPIGFLPAIDDTPPATSLTRRAWRDVAGWRVNDDVAHRAARRASSR